MKKILCLIDSLGSGGAQRQLVGLASFLKERDYEVTVAMYHNKFFYVDELLKNSVPYVYLKKAETSFLRIWHIARYIRRLKPDVVISYLETPSICASVIALFNHKFKLIVSERNTTQHTGWKEKIRFNLFRLADYVVPNAYSQEQYIRENFPCLADKIVTIPNFVDLDYFTPVDKKKRRDVPEIMVVASIWASKNTLGFIDAVAALKEKKCRFHVNWYGKDESNINYYNRCQDKIMNLGLSDFICLKEKTSDIKERYQESDLFCLPSFFEGTPNVICEALACGLPILCSNVCDNSEYVIESVNGFLFNPHDSSSICDAFEKMLSLTEKQYEEFCVQSRNLAEKKLSKDRFIQSYISLIEA